MAALVNDLLDIARITRGKLVLRRERISLSTVLDTALEASVPRIEARGHRLQVTRPNRDPEIDGDPVRLPQVLTNLLNNASRHTPRGGCIHMDVTLSGRDLQIAVKDNGIGIAPHAQGRIFEMFEQGNAGAHDSQGGLGIGLALVKAVVELHGGWVTLRSDGRGGDRNLSFGFPLSCFRPPDGPIGIQMALWCGCH
jgi:signal transduction histidine kinase